MQLRCRCLQRHPETTLSPTSYELSIRQLQEGHPDGPNGCTPWRPRHTSVRLQDEMDLRYLAKSYLDENSQQIVNFCINFLREELAAAFLERHKLTLRTCNNLSPAKFLWWPWCQKSSCSGVEWNIQSNGLIQIQHFSDEMWLSRW